MLNLALALVALAAPSVTTPKDVEKHIRYLAGPQLEGRMTLSGGIDKAASYIESEFKKYGLKPGPNGKYSHDFEITINQRPGSGNRLSTFFQGKETKFDLTRDFVPLVGSTDDKEVTGRVVSIGEGNPDSYSAADVKEKIAMFSARQDAASSPMSVGARAQKAVEKGAIGIIVYYQKVNDAPALPRFTRGQGIPADLKIPAIAVTSAAVGNKKLSFGPSFSEKVTKPKDLGITATLKTKLEPNKGFARNVVGYLPGTDPQLKNEYIIVGAHYDHLGYGETGSRTGAALIHYGADDNASGTAGVLALAKHFAEKKVNKRTMIFQLYSGEEIGLIGSNAWAQDNPEILKSTTAMLNMDMIGRLREKNLDVFGTSTSDAWDEILKPVNVDGVTMKPSPNVRPDSDQASFARRNVPILAFFTGIHDEYHTEKDTADTINYEGVAQVLDVVAQVMERLDKSDKLTWNANAILGMGTDQRANSQGRRIRVGFIPDMTSTGTGGATISGVSANSPAEKAGFKAGDKIVEFNGVKVEDLETLNEAMKTCKPGDKVKVKYIRDGKPAEAEIIVEERIGG